jgi:hypothetical protein
MLHRSCDCCHLFLTNSRINTAHALPVAHWFILKGKKMKNFKLLGAVFLASVLGFAPGAFAAVPASVTTAITTAETDVGLVGAAILGVLIIIAGFMWIRKVMH